MLAAADLHQSVALTCIGAYIEHKTASAVALVECFRPMRSEPEPEPVELDIAELAAVDAPGADTFAESECWTGAEFARTAVVTIAGLEKIRFEAPFDFVTHRSSYWLSRKRASADRCWTCGLH